MSTCTVFDIAGRHAYASINGANAFESDWNVFCKSAVDLSRLHVVAERGGQFKDGTQVFMAVLSESSFVATLAPNRKSASVHCYTCGSEGAPAPAVDKICAAFKDAAILQDEIARGNVPSYGIFTPRSSLQSTNTLAIADNRYAPVSSVDEVFDNRAFDSLYRIVAKRAEGEVMILKHGFEPQGMTAVMCFMTPQGPAHVDMHTYPENDYVSFTAAGPRRIPVEIMADVRMAERSLIASNRSSYSLDPVSGPLVAARKASSESAHLRM